MPGQQLQPFGNSFNSNGLRAYPDNSLASTGCVGRGLRQAASTMLDIVCFAFLVHNRLARSLADEWLSG